MISIRSLVRGSLLFLFLGLCVGNAWANPALEAQSSEKDDADEDSKKPWMAMVIVDNTVGLGTFVQGVDQRASYTLTVDGRAGWKFDDHQQFWLRLPISQQLVQNYDSTTTTPQQILLGDVELRYIYNNLFKLDDPKFSVSTYFYVAGGTSLSARYQSRLVSLRPGVRLATKLGPANFYYEGRFTKNFHRYTSPTLDGGLGIAIARLGGSEDLAGDVVAAGGVNSEFTVLNRLTAVFSLPADLSLTLDFAYIQSWSYAWDNDDGLTAANADTGRNLSDLSQAVIDVSWQSPVPNLIFSSGVVTAQTPKTANNDGFRFPFFDFIAPNSNSTTFYLDAIATF